MKKIIKFLNEKERYIIQNITLIAILLIIIILLIDILPLIINLIFNTKYNFISTQFTITTIGGIFAFWYGYKKYERDKELEIIEKYTKKYNKIIGKKSYYELIENKEYINLINLWVEEFHLYNQGYIPKKLWSYWIIYIEDDISELLFNDILYFYNKKYKGNKKITILKLIEENQLNTGTFSLKLLSIKEIDNIFGVFIKNRLNKLLVDYKYFKEKLSILKNDDKKLIDNLKGLDTFNGIKYIIIEETLKTFKT